MDDLKQIYKALYQAADGASIDEISTLTGLSSARVETGLAHLVSAGLIEEDSVGEIRFEPT